MLTKLKSWTYPLIRPEINFRANSESPLKRTKCLLYIDFSLFQWIFAMSRGIDSTAGEWSGAISE